MLKKISFILISVSTILFGCTSCTKNGTENSPKKLTLSIYDSIRIKDEGENIRLEWKTYLATSLIKKYIVKIEGIDTTILLSNDKSDLSIKRQRAWYNKAFTVEINTIEGQTLTLTTPKYENMYTNLFTCKNKYIAHRGLSGLYPENTAIAFEMAADAGFEYLECDIYLTKDHQWVVIHDDTIDRTSDGSGKVSQYTFDELQKFNFGLPKTYGNKYPQKISSLKDFVGLCRMKNLKPLIEIKQGNISEADRKSMLNIVNGDLTYDKYAFHSFDIATLYAIRKVDKEVILGITTSSYAPTHIKDLSNLYPCFYNLGSSGFTINQSFNAQSNQNIYSIYLGGIFVCIWTIDDPKYFDFLTSNNLYVLTNTLPPVFK